MTDSGVKGTEDSKHLGELGIVDGSVLFLVLNPHDESDSEGSGLEDEYIDDLLYLVDKTLLKVLKPVSCSF